MRFNNRIRKSYVRNFEGSDLFRDDIFSFYTHGGGKDGGGGGGGYSPPPAPDPTVTAAAQGGQDRATAQTNALLLNPTIKSPFGSVSYDQNSYNVDPSNTIVTRPTQTTTLSPAEQERLDATNQISGYIESAGKNWAQMLPNKPVANTTPTTPTTIDYSNVSAIPTMADYQTQADKSAKANYDAQYSLMQPSMDLSQRNLENKLVNSGNPMGSEDYDTQMKLFRQDQNSALQNLANNSVNQGYNVQNQLFNAANATRQNQISMDQLPYNTSNMIASNQIQQDSALQNQNINALSSMLQGTQAIQLPAGAGYAQQALSAPNIMAMTEQNYQSQLNGYNQMYMQQNAQNNASSNAFTSGLFSLGSAALGLF